MAEIPPSAEQPASGKIVLVMLSTGKQGGAVVRALAQANESAPENMAPWVILAQTRDPNSAKSKALESLRGVRLHKGNPNDPTALFTSAPGPVYAVFSVQQSIDNVKGVAGETVEANALVDAAAKHDVKHFVYSSVNFGGPDKKTYVPHFESKRLAEEYLQGTYPKLPTTILRPVTFMDQIVAGDPNSATTRLTKIMFLTQLNPTTSLQFIAVSDIGGVAALALQNPERYIGKDVDLAGDQLSSKDLADGWREVFGEEMRPRMMGGAVLAWAVRAGMKELRLMFKFFNETGFNTDIPALREQYPGLKDWKTFLRTEVQKPTST
ncbi:nucleoside-diphosphate-sugar epimerase family protein [Mycena maculata]|uniref:Nucleoside-diphosphate-sugar epimerase family protein n=1 Tax=Mycena maculata TaxID=230809 RepID=A0AAD7HP19_9AGAR|nr:nucleoside-diphosphate-sugar epimerase family protein [Mycena maculata]